MTGKRYNPWGHASVNEAALNGATCAPQLLEPVQSRPVVDEERIAPLDVLRGFALLGILVMNIQSFAMIDAAYMNPNGKRLRRKAF